MVVDARFTQAHLEWLDKHLQSRKGEARRKLKTGHAHAERLMLEHIWWPAFGHFDHLHPEYEVSDYFDGKRYIDFALIRAGIYIAIEIDPFGTHYAKLDRRQFSNQWVRQMHLFNDSWSFIRISYDDLIERPRLWQQLLQQMVGRLFGDHQLTYELSASERDILRLALRLSRPIKLADVQTLLQCGYDTARKQLTMLEHKKWLKPQGKGLMRTHAWRLDSTRKLPPL
jgi:hypothetical protein